MIPEPESLTYNTELTNCSLGFANSSPELQSSAGSFPDYGQAFREIYRREFGFELVNRDILVDDVRVRVTANSPSLQKFPIANKSGTPQPDSQTRCYFESGWHAMPLFLLHPLGAVQRPVGPVTPS